MWLIVDSQGEILDEDTDWEALYIAYREALDAGQMRLVSALDWLLGLWEVLHD